MPCIMYVKNIVRLSVCTEENMMHLMIEQNNTCLHGLHSKKMGGGSYFLILSECLCSMKQSVKYIFKRLSSFRPL